MCNAIPVFEAKNKLPFFIHLAETEGPVPITRHNQEVAYIISKSDYDKMNAESKPQKSLAQRIHDSRTGYSLTDDDDFDYTEYFDSLRDRNYFGLPRAEHIFDDVSKLIDDIYANFPIIQYDNHSHRNFCYSSISHFLCLKLPV